MSRLDKPHFVVRAETDAHSCFLVGLAPKRADEYSRVADLVFQHQPAVYYQPSKGALNPQENVPNIKTIADHFYRTQGCFIWPQLLAGISGALRTIDEFESGVVFEQDHDERNHLSFLLGEVGVGKTALVNALITNKGVEWVTRKKTWFVRLDLDIEFGKKPVQAHDLLRKLIGKTLRVLEDNPILVDQKTQVMDAIADLSQSFATPFISPDDETRFTKQYREQQAAFRTLIKAIKAATGRRLFLIIDNLDYIYRISDQNLFRHDDDTQESQILLSICDLAMLFFHGRDLGNLGINALFVMRRESYEILTQTALTSFVSAYVQKDNRNVFTVKAPPWGDVLLARSALLHFVATRVKPEGKSKEFSSLFSMIDDHITAGSDSPLIRDLEKLTNFGLRAMMEYFAQYVWLPPADPLAAEREDRFLTQYAVGMLTFILGRMRRFHERTSKFPNIYLIPTADQNGSGMDSFPYPYWLKRLLAHYVHTLEGKGARLTTGSILDVFCPGHLAGYEEQAVRLSLGSLTEANCSDMLRVRRARTLDGERIFVSAIALTPRGEHCLTSIFDKFVYLELVVDDHMLPIPRILVQEFSMMEDSDDYGYVLLPPEEYHLASQRMIRKKARRVLLLVEVLRAALGAEQALYKGVFDRLGNEGVAIPNPRVMRQGIQNELKLINSSYHGFMDLQSLYSEVDKYRSSIDDAMKEAYGVKQCDMQ